MSKHLSRNAQKKIEQKAKKLLQKKDSLNYTYTNRSGQKIKIENGHRYEYPDVQVVYPDMSIEKTCRGTTHVNRFGENSLYRAKNVVKKTFSALLEGGKDIEKARSLKNLNHTKVSVEFVDMADDICIHEKRSQIVFFNKKAKDSEIIAKFIEFIPEIIENAANNEAYMPHGRKKISGDRFTPPSELAWKM